MRWRTGRRSDNVEDRRSTSAAGGGFRMPGAGRSGFRIPGGLGGGMRSPGVRMGRRGGGLGLLGVVIVIGAALLFGIDPTSLLTGGAPGSLVQEQPRHERAPESGVRDDLADFVSVVLADTEDTWQRLFAAAGERYREPTLVLFSGAVDSACGYARAALGPFYCPADEKVYIDLGFYRDLRDRHGAPGDFAQAYVIAHEIGHHVQNLVGISGRVQEARRRLPEVEANDLSVRLELQADCLAGLWASHARARGLLETGDVDEALTAASAIGDDRLQRQAGGYVTPDSFTHGSSAQRVRWFRVGLETGRFDACNTFETDRL